MDDRHRVAMKVVPVPDFGIDEIIILALCGALLPTVYRPTLLAIVAQTQGEADPESTRSGT
jgi:hypothetical protein